MFAVNFFRVGAMLAHARKTQHLTGARVADAVGIHPVTLSRIEHGKLPGVTVAVLARLAWFLDIPMGELLDLAPGDRIRTVLAHASQA
jgi:transcriptional regulator with XRE-family HTH domain